MLIVSIILNIFENLTGKRTDYNDAIDIFLANLSTLLAAYLSLIQNVKALTMNFLSPFFLGIAEWPKKRRNFQNAE